MARSVRELKDVSQAPKRAEKRTATKGPKTTTKGSKFSGSKALSRVQEPVMIPTPLRKGAILESDVLVPCGHCAVPSKCFRRHFSDNAWGFLVYSNEISDESHDKPICNDCYEELREFLIDQDFEEFSRTHHPLYPDTREAV